MIKMLGFLFFLLCKGANSPFMNSTLSFYATIHKPTYPLLHLSFQPKSSKIITWIPFFKQTDEDKRSNIDEQFKK